MNVIAYIIPSTDVASILILAAWILFSLPSILGYLTIKKRNDVLELRIFYKERKVITKVRIVGPQTFSLLYIFMIKNTESSRTAVASIDIVEARISFAVGDKAQNCVNQAEQNCNSCPIYVNKYGQRLELHMFYVGVINLSISSLSSQHYAFSFSLQSGIMRLLNSIEVTQTKLHFY